MGNEEVEYIESAISEGESTKERVSEIIKRSEMKHCPDPPGIIIASGKFRICYSESDKEEIKDLEKSYNRWLVCVKEIYKKYGLNKEYMQYHYKIEPIFNLYDPRAYSSDAKEVSKKFKKDIDEIINGLDSTLSSARYRGRNGKTVENTTIYNTTFYGDIISSNVAVGDIKSIITQTIQETSLDKQEMRDLLDEVISYLPEIERTGKVDRGILRKISDYFERNSEACTQLAFAVANALLKWSKI